MEKPVNKAQELYRRLADLHSAHTRVKAVFNTFPAREVVPQNAPERRLRHVCERYENEMGKVALAHFDAVREDIRSRRQAA